MPKSKSTKIRRGKTRRSSPDAAPLVGSAKASGRVPRMLSNMGGVHRFSRFTGSDLMTLTGTTVSGGSISLNNSGLLTLATGALQNIYYLNASFAFALQDLPAYTEFTTLFERYRIDMVEVKLTPFYTVADAPVVAGNGSVGGMLHSVVDYNDYGTIAATQAGLNSIRQRPSYTTQNVTAAQPMVWRFRPRVAIAAYAAGFGAYANLPAPWCDTVSTAVEHYGLKWVFEIANTGPVVQYVNFKMEARYHISCTDVK